jgi:hypothetical protein
MTTLAEKRRMKFEYELNDYSIETFHAGRSGRTQPPYMRELRALYMAVRETHKGGMKKGQTVNHEWPGYVGKGGHDAG